MSKPKNRVMCPDCGRQKILFESESKANNFIKWNKDEIENGDKLRSYYCPACCGWHISHQKFHKDMEGRTDKLIENYNKEKELGKLKHGLFVNILIEELYQEIKRHNLQDRKSINQLLYKPEYSNYSSFVKQEAKVRYYTEINI
jgi:predicted RNA-binding Zn-ribbon protein involved in translation (DUF1610 family)